MERPPLTPASRVELTPGFRLQWEPAQQAHVLLYPEGMVTLNESATEVLKRCDGRPLAELLTDLQGDYPGAELEADVFEFMEMARDQGWLRIR
ncbi:MAG TPA: pyrroloquinoline quinone biosynthesis peptide chaperone PqqD [Gammaproteobacteria bacterium]|nr:pyrroloquinoline quinone biosynthesis peptide chaperone PqqD [Gammaproteobacteria bacterium]